MPREKNKRKINFLPIFTKFIPSKKDFTGVTNILDEEIEAIYLMDVLELYQEEAASKMEVSRTTFTRILKNARKKLTNSLVYGHKINIQSDTSRYTIALCCNNNNYKELDINKKYIYFLLYDNKKISLIDKIDNPIYEKNEKPAIVLPKLFLENSVNIFISSKIGEGLKNSLISKGLNPIVMKSFSKEEFEKKI